MWCARARASVPLPCLLRVVSLFALLPFVFVTPRKQTKKKNERRERKNVKRERERERPRTDPIASLPFWNLPATEIDYYCSRGLSASLEEIFFFFSFSTVALPEEKRFFFATPPLCALFLWKTFLTLSSGLKFVVLLSFSRTREFPRPFHLEQLLSALLSAREI